MSMKLENTVIELIEQQKTKKQADSLHYRTDKQYKGIYQDTMVLLKQGDRMPRGSDYFAEIVKEERGSALPAYVLQKVEQNYPQLRTIIERYRRQSREELIEKLDYGKR